MTEKETFRDNLEAIRSFFPNRPVLTIPDVSRFMQCDASVLYRDKRFREYTFEYGKQFRITAANLARWLS